MRDAIGLPQVDGEYTLQPYNGSTPSVARTEPFSTTMELPSRPSSSAGIHDPLDILSRDVKRMMDTIQRLRILGFENSVVSLPKIVVIGDQSTGKSSVIEAISDIRVPRAVGTCTRCPLEINLTHSDTPWACKVFLSRRFSYNPTVPGVGKNNPYGPWQQLDTPEEFEFASFTDKKQVADTISWAQRATLNPSTNYQLFRPGDDHGVLSSEEVEFSPNVIRLDISGSGLPNLAFYDLPGLISHVESDEQQYLVRLVDNLAKEYMKSEETLILLTLTMNHDVQNSKAAGLIQKAKADHRTIGVFTKPDLLSPEAVQMFASVFAGSTFKRELGYFAMKNNPDARIEHSKARSEEKAFFQQWSKKYPAFHRYHRRFGTEHLTEELSKQLVQRIKQSLPKIRAIVVEKMAKLEARLKALPKPPTGNFSLEVATSLSKLASELKNLCNSESEDYEFFQLFSAQSKKFYHELTSSHPRLTLTADSASNGLAATSRSPAPSIMQSREAIMIDDDDEPATPPGPSRRRATPAQSAREKRRTEDVQTDTNKRRRIEHARQQGKKTFMLVEVRDLISRKNDTGLRGNDNPRVTKALFSQSTEHWHHMTDRHLTAINILCGKSVMNLVREAFQNQRDTRLFKEIGEKSRKFLLETFGEHKDFVSECVRMAKIMFTLNDTASSHVKREVLKEMREERNRQLLDEDETLSDAQRQKKLAAARIKLETEDEWDAEIQQIATVRGYYDYAATRLAEETALSFRNKVFTQIREELCKDLTKQLRLEEADANKYLAGLLEMDPTVANERARCEQELARLTQGLDQLDELEEGGSGDTSWDAMSTQSTVL